MYYKELAHYAETYYSKRDIERMGGAEKINRHNIVIHGTFDFCQKYTYNQYWDYFINKAHLIPTAFEEKYVRLAFKNKVDDTGEKWMNENIERIKNIRKFFYFNWLMDKNKYPDEVKSELIEIIKKQSIKDKQNPLDLIPFIKSIYDKIIHFPLVMEPQEMYRIYYNLAMDIDYNSPIKEYTPKYAPWRSQVKFRSFSEKNPELIRKGIKITLPQTFNIKQNRKQYMLKCVSKPNTYMIDYVFFDRYCYLLAVNVNTRKAYTVRSFAKYNPETGKIKPNTYEAIGEMDALLKQTKISYIICDKEPAWTSSEFRYYLNTKHITVKFDEAATNHTTLAILNRVCRTIRNMLYNMKIPQTQCTPNVMNYIINEYNSSPHTTLTKIFHHKTCPNDVDDFMESVIIKTAVEYNDSVMNQDKLELGTPVKVYNDVGTFDKVKPKILDGAWYVANYDGVKYVVKDSKSGQELTVPRWMIIKL
jgi:hypothetical protein